PRRCCSSAAPEGSATTRASRSPRRTSLSRSTSSSAPCARPETDDLPPSARSWRMPPSNRPNPKEGTHMRKGKQALWAAIGVVALAALVAAATAPARTSAPAAPIKAAWIYVGPHNDGGWSQAHDLGRLYVQKKLGKNVVTTFKESVPEGPQASQVIDSLVRDGNKIIFATSFGYMDAMAAAEKYPDVYFEHATGYKTSKNFAVYFGAGEDSIYLSGMAAGAATKKGVIGYIV